MKSLHLLLQNVLNDCSTYCGTNTTRDFKTIARRLEHEGLSFLTITLGDFASDFELSLEKKRIDSTYFRSFRKESKYGLIPCLFRGMTSQVFELDGKLIDHPSEEAIFCIRQVCRMWKKILLPCSKERTSSALEGYINVERELSMEKFDQEISYLGKEQNLFDLFGRVSDRLWSNTLASANAEVGSRLSVIPRHGPGAVATKVLPNQKYDWTQWHQRLEPFFPATEFCYNSEMTFLSEGSKIAFVDPEREQPVRVVFVPKTLKSPRVIAIEPTCMQYTQQALLHQLVNGIEHGRLTSGHINFRDQSVNATLALESSKDGKLATLDLSEASDRVHSSLVYRMLKVVPYIRDAAFACRTTMAALPDGKTLHLWKFASMGSALCFPIESMVFYTILVMSELIRLRLPLNTSSINKVTRSIYVYGDDLIIPVAGVPIASELLEKMCLKVNIRKSFSEGNFRESCGMDAYNGVDVTTIYLRRMLPTSKRDVRGYISAVELSNQLHLKGFYETADYIERYLAKLGFDTPYVVENAACVGFVRFDKPLTIHRYSKKLHIPEVRGYVVAVKSRTDHIEGYPALMKWFLQGLNPDRNHYERSADSGRLTVKVRWCPVYSYTG